MFATLSGIYPEISGISLQGKNALMDNAHLVCEAYREGAQRFEILGAVDSGSLPTGLADDLMTLAVLSFCPEYTDRQLTN